MIPTSDVDQYSGQTLVEPHEQYRALRDIGPAVWLKGLTVHAVSRYDDTGRVLRDPDGFRSGGESPSTISITTAIESSPSPAPATPTTDSDT